MPYSFRSFQSILAVGAAGVFLAGGAFLLFPSCARSGRCLTGAFLADRSSAASIDGFQKDYGKKPFFVLMFLDWGKYPDEGVVRDIDSRGCISVITWEPWDAVRKTAIDYDALLAGRDDEYLRGFAMKLKAFGKPVFLRFAHEMNGDWYPWSAQKITPVKYQKLFKHVREVFDRAQAANVRWIFSINTENVPPENAYNRCYPGDRFVDYIGLDGYNWGTTQNWSRWRSFKEIFSGVYQETVRRYQKPVIITEFSSTSAGGDKTRWIEEALRDIEGMPRVVGLILFNVDKETDWRFPPQSECGLALKRGLGIPYFTEIPEKEL